MSVTQDSYAKIVNRKIGSAMAVFYKGSEAGSSVEVILSRGG